MEVSAKRTNGASVKVEYEFGSDLAGAVAIFGEDVIYQNAVGSLKVALQGWLRSQLDQGKSEADITSGVTSWKPGQRKQGKSPQEKLRDQLNSLTPEERAALLKEYKAKAA